MSTLCNADVRQYGQRPALPRERPIRLRFDLLRLSVRPGIDDQGLSMASAYVLLETPATTFLRTLRPSRFIPGATVLWGAVVLGSGFSKNYATQVAVRVLLGAMESALSPCLFLWMTTFYKRNEMASRSSYLYVAAPVSGIFGGLVVSDHFGIRVRS